jgi:hypothetical protein
LPVGLAYDAELEDRKKMSRPLGWAAQWVDLQILLKTFAQALF